jgi:phosphoribosylanthranilate isomerase
MMVKICGITNLEDAQAAVEAGASAIGFNFYHDSPRYVSPTGASVIAEKLRSDVIKVGVFVNETPDFVAKVAIQVGLDVAQLHGIAAAIGIRKWRAARANEALDEYMQDDTVEALLVDTPSDELYGGTGETFDWSRVRGLEKKIIVAGGLDEWNVRAAIRSALPWGVDACSRLEKSPGLKDHEKMKRFIEAALEG